MVEIPSGGAERGVADSEAVVMDGPGAASPERYLSPLRG